MARRSEVRKMKKLLALLLAAICLSGMAAMAEDSVTTTGSVNLRKGPGLDYRVICAIGEGVKLNYDRTGKDDRGVVWYRVSYDGKRGWVSSMYARKSTDGGSIERVTTTNNVRLRSGPGVDYASRLVIEAGTKLTYDKVAEDEDGAIWYHVTYAGKSGWISSRYARTGDGDISGKVTTTGDVNLRSGPDRDYASRDVVPEGTTLSYDRTEQDERGVVWYRVSYKGRTGWISSMYARSGSGGSSTRENQIRTTGSVHLRAGAGLDYASRGTIDEGVVLTYDRTEKDERGVVWYHVSYNGTKGWVSSRYARKQ